MTLACRNIAYFAVCSETLTAVEMSDRIGAEPDDSVVRGSRFTTPYVVPRTNEWLLFPRTTKGGGLDEQVREVLDRLRIHEGLVARLCTEDDCVTVLRIVREFRLSDVDSETLGVALDASDIGLLGRVGAFMDVSEYDLTTE